LAERGGSHEGVKKHLPRGKGEFSLFGVRRRNLQRDYGGSTDFKEIFMIPIPLPVSTDV
jgi:hypothetical protein